MYGLSRISGTDRPIGDGTLEEKLDYGLHWSPNRRRALNLSPRLLRAQRYRGAEAALRYHFDKRERATESTNKAVPMLLVLVVGASRLFCIEMAGSLRLRFAESCDPAYVAAVVAKLR